MHRPAGSGGTPPTRPFKSGRNNRQMFPNFLIIGAEKAGTTWLYDVLRRHPDIFLPDTKELSFFNGRHSDLKSNDKFVRLGPGWYENFFRFRRDESAVGDISPMYLCDTEAPARIAQMLPDVRLIAVLRDPVERAVSHYWMAYNKRHVTDSLGAVISRNDEAIIVRGLYGAQIERYLRHFPRENMLVLIFEEVMADRDRALDRLCHFLGVDPALQPRDGLHRASNPATAYRWRWLHTTSVKAASALRATRALSWLPRLLKRSGFNNRVKALNAVEFDKPELTEEERHTLRSLYAADRERLEELLGRKIEAWPR